MHRASGSAGVGARWRAGVVLMLGLSVGGCASLPRSTTPPAVAETARDRLGKRVEWVAASGRGDVVRAEIAGLLAQPLGVEDAVQVALLNNRGLQSAFAGLRVAETDLVQAGRLANPRFSTTRTRSGDSFKYETSLALPVLGLLTMPAALGMERQRVAAVGLEVSDRVLRLAAETRQAYFTAVAAEATVRYLDTAREALDATSELAQRMQRVGNLSRLEALRERAVHMDAATQLARARVASVAARERLVRLLGLTGEQASLRLPAELPGLPAAPAEMPDLESFALTRRLDLLAARRQAEATAASLGLVRATRFVNVLELGPATVLEAGEQAKKGYTISIELPLFDWGDSRVARAEAVYMQTLEQVAQVALEARSEVREAHAACANAWEVATRYRDENVPLRRTISEEHLLRYNGMLIGVFDLMADARDQIAAAQGYLDALRDFWLAEAALQQALGGRLPERPVAPPVSDQPDRKRNGG